MRVDLITVDGEHIMGMDTDCVFPTKGDVFVAPDGRLFIVTQRTYITSVLQLAPGKMVDLTAPKEVSIRMQCVLQPVKTTEDDNAIKS